MMNWWEFPPSCLQIYRIFVAIASPSSPLRLGGFASSREPPFSHLFHFAQNRISREAAKGAKLTADDDAS